MEVLLPGHLENYDRQTNQPTDMSGHRKVTLTISSSLSARIITNISIRTSESSLIHRILSNSLTFGPACHLQVFSTLFCILLPGLLVWVLQPAPPAASSSPGKTSAMGKS